MFEFTGEHEKVCAVMHDGVLETSTGGYAVLTPQQEAFITVLGQQPDTPFLATELRREQEDVLGQKSVSIRDTYDEVHSIFSNVGLGESLIKLHKVGAGKSTHYGILTSRDNETQLDFAHRGLYKISQKRTRGVQKYRQELPFKTLIRKIEHSDDVETNSHNKLLTIGGAAIALTLGTTSTVYMVMRHRD